ncbi:hypothetical protein HY218_01270 [Candidatus Saccharibacteria bacterium]|nr:hypothetical protein [Candidatus Saccharibacteria bacterium]
MPSKKKPSKNASKLQKLARALSPRSLKGGMLLFALIFALTGGGYFLFKTFAATERQVIYADSIAVYGVDGDGYNRKTLFLTNNVMRAVWSHNAASIALTKTSAQLAAVAQIIQTVSSSGTNVKTLVKDNTFVGIGNVVWLPGDGSLLFSASKGFNSSNAGYDLYTIKTDGTNLKKLTDHTRLGSVHADYFQVSLDGTKILFETNYPYLPSSSNRVYLVNIDGSNLKFIKPGTGTYCGLGNAVNAGSYNPIQIHPWAPDSRHYALFCHNNTGGFINIYSNSTTTIAPVKVTVPEGAVDEVSWSPSPNTLAYGGSTTKLGGFIATIYADGSNHKSVISASNWPSPEIDWSPLGDKIMYTLSKPPIFPLDVFFTITPSGTNNLMLINTSTGYASWRP